MKIILLLTVCFTLPVVLCAQTKIQQKQKMPEKFNQFKISPEVNPLQPDSLALSDTLPGMPEVYILPEMATPGKNRTDPYRMPIVRPDVNIRYNMPIYVPDSSVHYYIKQAMPDWPDPKKR